MKYHISVNIAGALKQRSLSIFEDENGRTIPTKAVKVFLRQEQVQDKKYYCGCDNTKADGSCGGHPTTLNEFDDGLDTCSYCGDKYNPDSEGHTELDENEEETGNYFCSSPCESNFYREFSKPIPRQIF